MNLYQITSAEIKYNLINLHQVVFEVTDACNLRCDYCIYSGMYKGFNKLSNNNLNFKQAKIILDYLIDIWEKHDRSTSSKPIFIGFYGGEPLLNMKVVKQIVDYVEKNITHKFKVIFSMTSNALLLDKYLDYLAEKRFQLLISLDGDKACSIFRKTVLKEESFPTVFKNIVELQNTYPDYFRQYVNFNTVYNQNTSFEATCDFFYSNFRKVPFISQINDTDVVDSKKEQFGLMFGDKFSDYINSSNRNELDKKLFLSSPIVSLLTRFVFNHSGNVYSTYNDLFVNKEHVKLIPTGTCIPFQKKLFITATGKILQCEKVSHKYVLGHIIDDSVDMDLNKIADEFNKTVRSFIKQCSSCSLSHSCSICVLQKSPTNQIDTCDRYCTKEKYSSYVDKNLELFKENPSLYEKILKDVAIY